MFLICDVNRVPMTDLRGNPREAMSADEAFMWLGECPGCIIDAETGREVPRTEPARMDPAAFDVGDA